MAIEIELKLGVAAKDMARLKAHPLLKAAKPVRKPLHNIYFDTPDFELYRKGIALRLRRVGYHWLQTLKAERKGAGLLTERPEWEVPVTGNALDFSVMPEEARALLGEAVMKRLAPCFVTDFARTAWELRRGDSVIEVALDKGLIQAGEKQSPIAELELELKAGDAAFLFETARQLLDVATFRIEPRSKAERGYAAAGAFAAGPCKAVPITLAAGATAEAFWHGQVAAALGQFSRNVPGYLADGDPEYLHQMRVAIRRLRTALGLGRRIGLDEPALDEAARWLMGILSPARDLDVFAGETLPAIQAGLAERDALEGLSAEVERRRRAAHRAVRDALDSKRCLEWLLAASERLLRAPGQDKAVEAEARLALDRRLKRVLRAASGFAGLDADGRHRLRIAVKKLRYTAEAFAPLFGGQARKYQALLARLQDALGSANDIAVAHRLLDESGCMKRHPYAVGLVQGWLARHASQRPGETHKLIKELRAAKPFWRAPAGKKTRKKA